jgi:hypothetical protein
MVKYLERLRKNCSTPLGVRRTTRLEIKPWAILNALGGSPSAALSASAIVHEQNRAPRGPQIFFR